MSRSCCDIEYAEGYSEGYVAGKAEAEARIATLTEALNERGRYGMPFKWQCKDYANGWISFDNEHEALNYSYETGSAMRVLYRAALHPKEKT